MSLRYTGAAEMGDIATRDLDRAARTAPWKDKIEVRLDNRQVFFLFFGSAVLACMLFVLGVIVGKRIESRGLAQAPDLADPMAVLDSRFRVRGTRNLRVVDASVFPRIPGVFIATNVYMISEKASDVIAEDNRPGK